jgi:hypothetical protein
MDHMEAIGSSNSGLSLLHLSDPGQATIGICCWLGIGCTVKSVEAGDFLKMTVQLSDLGRSNSY